MPLENLPNRLTSLDVHFDAVYVIESLRPGEPKTGSELYDQVIGPASYRLDKLETRLFSVSTRAELFNCLAEMGRRAHYETRWPLLHVETHGDEAGLELASSEFVPWDELAVHLQEVSIPSQLNFFVTLAACAGGYLAGTLKAGTRATAAAIIGPAQPVSAAELREAFGAFYSEFLTSLNGNAAIRALRQIEESQSKKYVFLPAMTMFRKTYEWYLIDDCSPDAMEDREREIIGLCRQLGMPAHVDDANALARIRPLLQRHEDFFRAFRDW
jgi:hypothetical protein